MSVLGRPLEKREQAAYVGEGRVERQGGRSKRERTEREPIGVAREARAGTGPALFESGRVWDRCEHRSDHPSIYMRSTTLVDEGLGVCGRECATASE